MNPEIRRLLLRWHLVREHIGIVERRLAELVDVTPTAEALTTVPGNGVVCAATLVAEIGDPMGYESPRRGRFVPRREPMSTEEF